MHVLRTPPHNRQGPTRVRSERRCDAMRERASAPRRRFRYIGSSMFTSRREAPAPDCDVGRRRRVVDAEPTQQRRSAGTQLGGLRLEPGRHLRRRPIQAVGRSDTAHPIWWVTETVDAPGRKGQLKQMRDGGGVVASRTYCGHTGPAVGRRSISEKGRSIASIVTSSSTSNPSVS